MTRIFAEVALLLLFTALLSLGALAWGWVLTGKFY